MLLLFLLLFSAASDALSEAGPRNETEVESEGGWPGWQCPDIRLEARGQEVHCRCELSHTLR